MSVLAWNKRYVVSLSDVDSNTIERIDEDNRRKACSIAFERSKDKDVTDAAVYDREGVMIYLAIKGIKK